MLRQWMDIATVDVLVARALQTYNHFAKPSSMSASGKSRSALFFCRWQILFRMYFAEHAGQTIFRL